MKQYRNPYALISDSYSAVLDILTEDERDYLLHVLDFEAMYLVVHDGLVDIVDDITGEVYNTEPITVFIHESIKFAMHDTEE